MMWIVRAFLLKFLVVVWRLIDVSFARSVPIVTEHQLLVAPSQEQWLRSWHWLPMSLLVLAVVSWTLIGMHVSWFALMVQRGFLSQAPLLVFGPWFRTPRA